MQMFKIDTVKDNISEVRQTKNHHYHRYLKLAIFFKLDYF